MSLKTSNNLKYPVPEAFRKMTVLKRENKKHRANCSELTQPTSYPDLTLSMSYVYRSKVEQPDFTEATTLNRSFSHAFLATAELYASPLKRTASPEKLKPVIATKSNGAIVNSSKGRWNIWVISIHRSRRAHIVA